MITSQPLLPAPVPRPRPGRGRYAGSILEVDFGEEGEAKQVVVVDLEPGRPAQIATHELTAARRLRRVREPLSGLAGMAADLGNTIVEVTVLPSRPTTSTTPTTASR